MDTIDTWASTLLVVVGYLVMVMERDSKLQSGQAPDLT
jgi:hypothetical protein